MKTVLPIIVLVSLSFALSGCGDSRAESAVPAEEPLAAATYKAGHGLKLTPVSRTFTGLATSEVAVRDIAQAQGAAVVPSAALLRTVKGDFVYVANGEWFLRTAVKVGARDATHFEIKEGLYEGDTIVTRGVNALWLAELQAVNGGVGCADGH